MAHRHSPIRHAGNLCPLLCALVPHGIACATGLYAELLFDDRWRRWLDEVHGPRLASLLGWLLFVNFVALSAAMARAHRSFERSAFWRALDRGDGPLTADMRAWQRRRSVSVGVYVASMTATMVWSQLLVGGGAAQGKYLAVGRGRIACGYSD